MKFILRADNIGNLQYSTLGYGYTRLITRTWFARYLSYIFQIYPSLLVLKLLEFSFYDAVLFLNKRHIGCFNGNDGFLYWLLCNNEVILHAKVVKFLFGMLRGREIISIW